MPPGTDLETFATSPFGAWEGSFGVLPEDHGGGPGSCP